MMGNEHRYPLGNGGGGGGGMRHCVRTMETHEHIRVSIVCINQVETFSQTIRSHIYHADQLKIYIGDMYTRIVA